MDKFGQVWSSLVMLDSVGFRWIPLDSVGFRWIHVSANMRPLSEFDARRSPVPDLCGLPEFEDVKGDDLARANLASG